MVKSVRLFIRLLCRALFPRLLFILHGIMCVVLVVREESNNKYWSLMFFLGLIVIEGIFNVLVRNGKEFLFFCPSAFFYCIVLIVSLSVLRIKEMNCSPQCKDEIKGDDFITKEILNHGTYNNRVAIIEQTGLLVLIVGRWLLPQGTISKDQFLQILLIYIGTAADIVEFSEIYEEDDIRKLVKRSHNVYYAIIAVWTLSVLQFSITIALPEEGLKTDESDEDDDDNDVYAEASYFRSKFPNKVAPMTYMHYKSMLRHSIDVNNGTRPSISQENALEKKQEEVLRKSLYKTSHLSQYKTSKVYENVHNSQSAPSFTTLNSSKVSSHPRILLPAGDRTLHDTGSPSSMHSPHPRKSSGNNSSNHLGYCESIRSNNSKLSNGSICTPLQVKNNFSSTTPPDYQVNRWRRTLSKYSFAFTNKSQSKKRNSLEVDNRVEIGKKEIKSCFAEYMSLLEILLPVCMQDGPFFITRFVLFAHFHVVTDMMVLLIIKNFLVIFIQIYRVILLYCMEPKNESDVENASNRLREAMHLNRRLSERNTSIQARTSDLTTNVLRNTRSRQTSNIYEDYDIYQVSNGYVSR